MKIPEKLHQFVGENALLLVSGTQAADFYLASEGTITKIGGVKLPKVHYSDRETVGRRGSNVFGSGSIAEKTKKSNHINFLMLVKDFVKQLSGQQKLNSVYLFAPAEIVDDVKKVLPAVLNKKVKLVVEGNLHKEKVADILAQMKKKLK